MTLSISFFKMAAAGNDFLVVDNRKSIVRNPKVFAASSCERHTGVGADGVLLLESSKQSDLRLRILNADGSEAEACGNGYRCAGLFAREVLKFPKSVAFETLAGEVRLDIRGQKIKAAMTEPKGYRPHIGIELIGQTLRGDFIDTGVPHVVIFSAALEEMPVTELGRAIRYHADFQPKGTNVNFAEVRGASRLAIRTYERGVEGETLACGTGAAASAICAVLRSDVTMPVEVETKGGDVLKVYAKLEGKVVRDVCLEGGAEFICEGKWLKTR